MDISERRAGLSICGRPGGVCRLCVSIYVQRHERLRFLMALQSFFGKRIYLTHRDWMTQLLPPVCMLNLLVVGMFTLNTWLHAYVSQA